MAESIYERAQRLLTEQGNTPPIPDEQGNTPPIQPPVQKDIMSPQFTMGQERAESFGSGGSPPPPDQQDLLKKMPASERAALLLINDPSALASLKLTIGEQTGVPVNVEESPVSLFERQALSWRRTMEEKLRYMKGNYPEMNIHLTEDDRLMMRVPNEQGVLEDRLIDPAGIDIGDFYDLTADMPRAALQIVTGITTGGMGWLAQGGAFAFASLVPDAIIQSNILQEDKRVYGDIQNFVKKTTEEDLESIGLVRVATDAAWEALFPGGYNVIRKSANRVLNPFNIKQGSWERQVVKAAERIKERIRILNPNYKGVDLSLSAQTGSEAVSRVESFSSMVAGGGALEKKKALAKLMQEELQFEMVGEVSEANVGREIVEALNIKSRKLGEKVSVQASRGEQIAMSDMMNGINKSLGRKYKGSQLRRMNGARIREKAFKLKKVFQDTRNAHYSNVYNIPAASLPFVPTDVIKEAAEKISKQVKPGPRTQILRVFDDPNMSQLLEQIKTMDSKMKYKDLVVIRNRIHDTLHKSEVLPNLSTSQRKTIANSFTQALHNAEKPGVAPNKKIADMMRIAREYNAKHSPPFKEKGIFDIFTKNEGIDAKNYIEESDIVNRIIDKSSGEGKVSADLWNRYKNFLGAESREFTDLKESVIRTNIMNSSDAGERYVNPQKFIDEVNALSPEIRNEVYGDQIKSILNSNRIRAIPRKSTVSKDELIQILSNEKGDAATELLHATRLQKEADQVWSGTFLSTVNKQGKDGFTDSTQVAPEKFVGSFLKHADAEDTRQVMRVVDRSPEMKGGFERALFKHILIDSQNIPSSLDVAIRNKSGAITNIDWKKLFDHLGDGLTKEKLTTVLGKEKVQVLEDVMMVTMAFEPGSVAGRTAGGLAAGVLWGSIAADLGRGELTGAIRIVQARLIASMLAQPWLAKMATGSMVIPDTPGLRQIALSSPALMISVLEEFAGEPDSMAQALAMIQTLYKDRSRPIDKEMQRSIDTAFSKDFNIK